MALFTILNKVLKLAEQIVDTLNVSSYLIKYIEFFEVLKTEKIISNELFLKMKNFVEYRNDIAHEYDEIRDVEIIWCVKNLDYIKEFLKISKKILFS